MKTMKTMKTIKLKATPKGCVGFYGLRRFPIVLYVQEWEAMLAKKDEIAEFIKDNRELLSFKDD